MQLKDMHRMDYTCNQKQFMVKSSEIPNGITDLPTEGVDNCSTVYVVDTMETYIFFKGTWYPQQ